MSPSKDQAKQIIEMGASLSHLESRYGKHSEAYQRFLREFALAWRKLSTSHPQEALLP
jgi:hypothetical protein